MTFSSQGKGKLLKLPQLIDMSAQVDFSHLLITIIIINMSAQVDFHHHHQVTIIILSQITIIRIMLIIINNNRTNIFIRLLVVWPIWRARTTSIGENVC